MPLTEKQRELVDEAAVICDRLTELARPDGPLKKADSQSGLYTASIRLATWIEQLELEHT